MDSATISILLAIVFVVYFFIWLFSSKPDRLSNFLSKANDTQIATKYGKNNLPYLILVLECKHMVKIYTNQGKIFWRNQLVECPSCKSKEIVSDFYEN